MTTYLRSNRWVFSLASMLSAALFGCAQGDIADEIEVDDEADWNDGKYEAWNDKNNPAFVDSTFSYQIADFPVEGEAKSTPWAGDYWATANDSINHRWDGETSLSPAEKVAAAFNLPSFPRDITNAVGIYGNRGRRACDSDADCKDLTDGSVCAKPRGATGSKIGRCIPTWWGICHGWAPAALSEPNPVRPVTKNGVTFYPGDLHALASFAYQTSLPTKFLSERCNLDEPNLNYDPTGRLIEGQCRDMNGGSFLVVMANMLGLRKVGIVEDRTFDDEVWNQPVRGYSITNAVGGKIPEITRDEAIKKLDLHLSFSTPLSKVDLNSRETKTGVYTAQAAGEVVFKLAGTGDADLYVKRGTSVTENNADCSSAGNDSNEECRLAVSAGEQVSWLVLGYSDSSKVTLAIGEQKAEANYTFNTAAKRFFYVEIDLRWISEAGPSRTANNPDLTTKTDKYQLIVETDQNGKVLGGEWVGASRQAHPDFMWWPNGAPRSLQSGLSYSMVKDLMEQAKADTTTPAEQVALLRKDFTLRRDLPIAQQSVTLGVPGGAKVEITMSGTGNADLYVKLGRRPTPTSYDFKSTGATSDEKITFTAPAAGGTYYVRTRGMATQSVVTVVAKITPAN
ncbi:MAG: pre-peptidase C-terminal domain-containing protein [Deltaproteobacteria bacterium]|nr:pre-peptidase C-terminal domain-containing protein [Deltaproteobacteria bacterium]